MKNVLAFVQQNQNARIIYCLLPLSYFLLVLTEKASYLCLVFVECFVSLWQTIKMEHASTIRANQPRITMQ